MKSKSETIEKFRGFKALVEKETNYKLIILRTDRGGKYLSHDFIQFPQNFSIYYHLTIARILLLNLIFSSTKLLGFPLNLHLLFSNASHLFLKLPLKVLKQKTSQNLSTTTSKNKKQLC